MKKTFSVFFCNRKIRIASLLFALYSVPVSAQLSEEAFVKKVNTQIGSKGKGHGIHEQYLEAGYTFPGAMSPFGMVQFTTTFFNENKGFVINQMSGAGCEHMGNLPMLPFNGELKKSPNDMKVYSPDIKILTSEAGFYKADVNHGVTTELTVTPRTGIARITFTENKGTVVIGSGVNATYLKESSSKITGKKSFEGFADGGEFCGSAVNYKIYFVAQFNVDAEEYGVWEGEKLTSNKNTTQNKNSGVYFTFNTTNNKQILYKVGISYVSIENARENLVKENNQWAFDKTVHANQKEWNKYLSKIEVSGSTEDHIIQFYTGLYHTFTHPNIFNDVNGDYQGADGKVHRIEKGKTHYTGFSNWDTYRTQIHLLSMLIPDEASAMVNSMITFAKESGGGFPRWVLNSTETGIMQGDPTSALVANAYAFGAKKFDLSSALEVMRRGAEVPGTKSQNELTRPFLDQYLEKGFTKASMMLEYTSADFAIGQFALQAFNNKQIYEKYLKRARYWKNIYNPETKWLNSRNEDGSWKNYNDDWRELSYKGYFWMVPYNLKGLIDTIGGNEFAEKRLDEFFSKLNANYHEEWFAAGNEPDFQTPWIYNWTGQPYKTQALVKRIIKEQYANRANGLPGNDDMGAMGAFYVLSNIGVFPVIPGVGGLSLNSPSFPLIKIRFPENSLIIKGGSADQPYIQNMKVNNKTWDNTWITLDNFIKAKTINFQLSETPNKQWGTSSVAPSYQ